MGEDFFDNLIREGRNRITSSRYVAKLLKNWTSCNWMCAMYLYQRWELCFCFLMFSAMYITHAKLFLFCIRTAWLFALLKWLNVWNMASMFRWYSEYQIYDGWKKLFNHVDISPLSMLFYNLTCPTVCDLFRHEKFLDMYPFLLPTPKCMIYPLCLLPFSDNSNFYFNCWLCPILLEK